MISPESSNDSDEEKKSDKASFQNNDNILISPIKSAAQGCFFPEIEENADIRQSLESAQNQDKEVPQQKSNSFTRNDNI